jgi:hypothetical protein
MNRYTLRKDPKYDTHWIALPNNGGEVGDLSDITCELNRLLGNYEVVVDECNALIKALEECKEDSIELLGERSWWKDEPRSDYKKRYEETSENITRADKILAIVKGISNE